MLKQQLFKYQQKIHRRERLLEKYELIRLDANKQRDILNRTTERVEVVLGY